MAAVQDLPELLVRLDPDAPAVERHLWLVALFDWIRGDCTSVPASIARVQLLMDAFQIRREARERLQVWWQKLIATLDGTALLADYGFSSNSAFMGELVDRILKKILPGTPETADASALFSLVLCHRFDAQWLSALDEPLLARIAELLQPAQAPNPWQATLLEAITFCTSQIRATGFSPELRLRMSAPAREASPFHALARDFDALREACMASTDEENLPRQAALHQFRERLDACRQAASTVYTHLEAHGISVDLVFQLRQLRERVLRIRALLDCLLSAQPAQSTARLLAHLVTVGQERRSVRVLIAANTSLLAAKVAERSSETGEHYITRTMTQYRNMVRQAAGGGALTALTTWMKFGVMTLGFSVFWSGFWAGAGYAASFILIQLLHFTLATKQPAMTAPAMAAKLKDLSEPSALDAFADEVTHLVRSQVAAVLGNVILVIPVVVVISALLQLTTGHAMIDAAQAHYVFKSLTLWGPTALFAAFTGVLLFASSIMAGWTENWFVLHRLDSAMRYNPKITDWLGVVRADRWAIFMRANISGFAANISLGFMLGLIPAFADFFGLGLEVRHVTLSAGQLGAACAALGWGVLHESALWWCVLALPVMGALNLGVSFYLAFRLALRAHNVTGFGRARISEVIGRRWVEAPLSFFWPVSAVTAVASAALAVEPPALPHKKD